ncbi:hypothetical protein FPRO03_13847 [Fusarium proliferatum]|nr:hypothetical protein FPRO03_13847 [Fusarium proliferatum]
MSKFRMYQSLFTVAIHILAMLPGAFVNPLVIIFVRMEKRRIGRNLLYVEDKTLKKAFRPKWGDLDAQLEVATWNNEQSQLIRDVQELCSQSFPTISSALNILVRYATHANDVFLRSDSTDSKRDHTYPHAPSTRSYNERDLVCPDANCGYSANEYQDLQRHYRMHVQCQEDCPFCLKPLERVSQFARHPDECAAPYDELRSLRGTDSPNQAQTNVTKGTDISYSLTTPYLHARHTLTFDETFRYSFSWPGTYHATIEEPLVQRAFILTILDTNVGMRNRF